MILPANGIYKITNLLNGKAYVVKPETWTVVAKIGH